MAATSLLARLGLRIATLGSAASLAIAAPLAEGDVSQAAHTDASRIGVFFDRTPSAERMGFVVMGAVCLNIGVDGLSSPRSAQVETEFYGYQCGNTTASGALGSNTGFGHSALKSLTTAIYCTAVGASALESVTTGNSNTAVGRDALQALTTGSANVGIGVSVLLVATAPTNSVAIGWSAASAATTVSSCVAIGRNAGRNLTNITGSVLIGFNAGVARGVAGVLTNALVIGAINDGGGSQSYINNVWIEHDPTQTQGPIFNHNIAIAGVVTVALGTNLLPTYSFTGDTNTGIYSSQADRINMAVNGVKGFTLSTTDVALGHNTSTGFTGGGLGEIAIGLSATTNGVGSIAIGAQANTGATFTANIAIGPATTCTAARAVAIGRGATAAASEVVFGNGSGGNDAWYSNFYMGSGKASATPVSVTIQAGGAAGTDIAGPSTTIAGGRGTGTGLGGRVFLATSPVLTTGTTQQTLVNRLCVFSDGGVQIGGTFTTSPGVNSLQIAGGYNVVAFSVLNSSQSGMSFSILNNGGNSNSEVFNGCWTLKGDPALPIISSPRGFFSQPTVAANRVSCNVFAGDSALQIAANHGSVVGGVLSLEFVSNVGGSPHSSAGSVNARIVNALDSTLRFWVPTSTASTGLATGIRDVGGFIASGLFNAVGGLSTAGDVIAGAYFRSTPQSVNASATITSGRVKFTGSTAAQTLTLPAGVTGTDIFIRNASSVSVTIARAGVDTIEGANTFVLLPGEALSLTCVGTDWTAF